MTVGEMLVRMDADELISWQAYEIQYGPLPERRMDYLAAQVVAAVKNGYLKEGHGTSVEKELIRFQRPEPKVEETDGGPVREPEWKRSKKLFLAWAREDAAAQKKTKPRRKAKKTRTPQGP
jgi:hypothetical protein